MFLRLIYGFVTLTLFSMILFYYTFHDEPIRTEIYSGLLKYDIAHYSPFYPCGTMSRWDIEFVIGYRSRIKFPKRPSRFEPPGKPIYIELEGYLSKAGVHGPEGLFSHILEVTKVVKVGSSKEIAACEISPT